MIKHQVGPFFWLVLFSFAGFQLLSCTPPTTNFQTTLSETAIPEITVPPQTVLSEAFLYKHTFQTKPFQMSGASSKALASFYHSLNRLLDRNQPVNILHLGDSHTVNDQFSGKLRQLFQTRFGSAGRGMLPVGKPYHYFQPSNVNISQTKGWTISNSHTAPADGPYGLSGFRIQSSNPNDSITLTMTDGTQFDVIEIEFLRHPSSGTLVIDIDEGKESWELATAAPSHSVESYTRTVTGGGHRIKISPQGDGPIELLSWTFKRHQSGVIYHSHGIVGAAINVINHWHRTVVSAELERLVPSLIIVAFGTNEGFQDELATDDYARDFQQQLAFLQSAAPQAAIVVVGPPDGNRLPGFCEKRLDVGCSPLTPAEFENYLTLLAQTDKQLCRWHSPPKLAAVREIQQAVAVQAGYWFWDWSTVMGGTCGTHRWTQQQPPFASPDHVHLTERGYHLSAEALFNKIMTPYLSQY